MNILNILILFLNNFYTSIILLLTIFLIIPLFALLFLSIWIYKDTKKRNMNPFIWILVIWLIPCFLGLIIYIVHRE